ncbi:MAG: hypothetical protein ACTHNU_09570 [Gaiellales bacterium]|jgi:hypothetical protein
MSWRHKGMSEYQVRTRLYDPPEAVRRVDSKLSYWKSQSGPRLRGEDMRLAFERRLEGREADVVAAPAAEVVTLRAPRKQRARRTA